MAKLKWHTEKRKVKDLLPYKKNPRKITEYQMKQLKKSLKKFDLVEIPAINTDGTLIAGHQRIKALKLLGKGEMEIEVRVPSRKLTAEEFKEYNLRSNKNVGEFDFNFLAELDADVLREVGFEEGEVNLIKGDFDRGDKEEFDSIIQEFTVKEESDKNKQWFYVEFYKDEKTYDDLLKRMQKAKVIDGKHTMDPKFFKKLLIKEFPKKKRSKK